MGADVVPDPATQKQPKYFETLFNPRVCQAWVSIASEIPHNEQCRRIQAAGTDHTHAHLLHELRHFLSDEDSERAARQLSLLIDGIWVRGELLSMSSAVAIDEMEYALLNLLPADENSVSMHRLAREKIENIASIVLDSQAYREKAI